MVIKIDYRELKLIDAISPLCTPFVENLLLGDACLYQDPPQGAETPIVQDPALITPCAIIERKTVPDMIASLKDGRYLEQKARLDASPVPNHNILFIIEGPRVGVPHIHAAVFSLFYHSGFGVLFTSSVNDTARVIFAFDRKLNKDPNKSPYYCTTQQPHIPTHPTSYAAFLKPEKKANVCKENVWIIMLQQLPHISSSIARALMEKFETIPALIDAIKENPSVLETFKITGTDGKSRKLSSRAATTIQQLLV